MSTTLKKLMLTLGCAFLCVGSTTFADSCDTACEPSCCDSCCGNFSAYVEWLYLRPCADGIFVALRVEEGTEPGQDVDTDLFCATAKNFDFELSSGVRLGLGYSNPDCFCWDVSLDWTYYSPSDDQKEKVKPPGTDQILFPFFCLNVFSSMPFSSVDIGDFGTEVKADWDLESHLVDLNFAFPFCLNECFQFRPHFGLRYAHIDQELTSKAVFIDTSMTDTPTIIRQRYHNQFNGVGPRGGFGMSWDLGCGFGVYGDLAITAAYGEMDGDHHLTREEFNPTTGARTKGNKEKSDNTVCCSRFISDVGFGAHWCTTFCECMETKIRLGWEHHVFFNQGVADGVVACILITKETNSDLSTQGLVLGLGVEF